MFACNKRSRIKTLIFMITTSLLSGYLSGCRDFSNVKELGDTWVVIDQTAGIIANDFYQSCLRAAKHPASTRIFAIPDYFDTVEAEKENCDQKYLPDVNNIAGAYATYTEYLKQLSILADPDTSAVTSEQQDELQEAIGNLFTRLDEDTNIEVPLILSENIDTGVNIIAAIFGFIGDEIRQNAIAPTIVCTNDDVRKYSDGLMAISAQVYVNQLRNERGAFESNIANFTPVIEAVNEDPQTITIQESRDLFYIQNSIVEKDISLDEREGVARSFSVVLDRTAKTHAKLSETFTEELELTDKRKKQTFCDNYEQEAAENANIDREASLNISPQVSIEVAQILNEYDKDIQPLIDSIIASRFYQKSLE